ncbi:MAG: DUF342 domain-containing protein [Eubacterium sp.]|nr:DUF342 domain-containing protein [Eubacterium sp.]
MAEANSKAEIDMAAYAKQGFDALQCEEIRRGLAKNIDVSLYAKKELSPYQMREIRSGIEKGVSMVAYANPRLEPFTIRALALGKEHNIDAMLCVGKGHQGKKVYEYVRGRMEGIDLIEYLDRGFDADQLSAIIEAHKKNINIKPYLGLNLYGVQLEELILGIENGVDVSRYASGGFNWMQMQVIRENLEKKLDVKPILDPDFTPEQMKEICIGIERGLDTARYAKVELDPEQIAGIRDQVAEDEELDSRVDEIMSQVVVSDLLTMDDLPTIDFDIGSEAEKLLEQNEVVNPALELAKELIGDIADKIENAEEVELELKRDIHILVSEDKMSVTLNLTQPNNNITIGVREVMRALREFDVKQGIKQDVIKKMIDEQMFFTDMVIAEGKPAVMGKDGYFDYHFRKEVKSTPKLLPNGSVDYKGIELFETVEKGQVIADYISATAGEFGYDVYGNILTPERGKELPSLKGKGFHVSENGKQYIADVTGIIEMDDDGNIEVRSVYNVDGDVDLAVGNINFDGDVNIMGNVEAGYLISASGNVTIEGNCEQCSIFAGKDILIKGGVQGRSESEINAKGNVIGQFFESCVLKAEGDITCTYLLNCNTTCEGFLSVAGRRGVIIGGHTVAKTGIECFGIGNVAESKSIIEVGVGDGDTKAYQILMDKCEKLQKDIVTLEEGIDKIVNMEERTAQVEEFYNKLTNALYTQKEELKGLLEEREIRIVKMTAQKDAEIDVKGTVYPGTRIFVSSVVYMVRETLKNVRFLKKDGKVGYQIRTKL